MKIVCRAALVLTAILIQYTSAFSQTWDWASQIASYSSGGDPFNEVIGITVDDNENVYIAGDYGDSVLIGGTKLKGIPVGTDMFVAKLNSSGTFSWAKSFGSQSGLDQAMDLVHDNSGNVYVSCAFSGTLTLDTVHLNSVSISSVALAKYDPNGNAQWARYVWNVMQGPGGLVFDSDHIYVAVGHTLAKYTQDGDTVWSRTMPDNGSVPTEFYDVAADMSGNIYVTGLFTGLIRLGNDTLRAASITDQDIVVAKFDKDGNILWARQAGAVSSPIQKDVGRSITVAPSGYVYVVGEYKGKAFFEADSIMSGNASTALFVAKYDGDGHLQWVKGGNGPNLSSSTAYNVKSLDNEDILVEATFGMRVNLPDTFYTAGGGEDVLMLRLAPDGTRRWGKRSDTFGPVCYGYGLALNGAATSAYVGGLCNISATFGPSTITGPHEGWIGKMTIASITGVSDSPEAVVPRTSSLLQNFPNPFNPSTTISYELSQSTRVDVEIFNTLGESIRTLIDASELAGHHALTWDGRNDQGQSVSNGVYFYQMRAGDVIETKKMILLK